ncbi:T9SS type A sorting domain-containing protein, partial [Salegentibacter sp. F14]
PDVDGVEISSTDAANYWVDITGDETGETIWVRLDTDEDGDEDCYTLKSFDIFVYDNPDFDVEDLMSCEDVDEEGGAYFSLMDAIVMEPAPDGTDFTFYDGDPDVDGVEISSTDAANYWVDITGDETGETIWVRLDTDEDGDEDCYTLKSFDIFVYDNPDITITPPDFICVGDQIDLSMYVSNPDGGELTYYDNMTAADEGGIDLGGSVVTPELGTTVYWVRSELTYGDTVCYSIDSISVTVETCIIDQGCTLGYWKNHTDDWCQNTYTIGEEEVTIATCTLYGDVFEDAPLHIAGLTLYAAISLEGNSNGENLARQSVAALLNTCSSAVGFAYSSVYTLIEDVNLAWSGDSQTEKSFAMDLDYMNNANCPLGGSANTEPSSSCINGAEASIEESSFRTMTTEEETVDFRVYPLPFTANLSVQYEFGYTSDVTLEFYNITGQLLRTYEDKQVTKGDVTELTLDFATQANQIYILRVITDRDVFFKKILSGN